MRTTGGIRRCAFGRWGVFEDSGVALRSVVIPVALILKTSFLSCQAGFTTDGARILKPAGEVFKVH